MKNFSIPFYHETDFSYQAAQNKTQAIVTCKHFGTGCQTVLANFTITFQLFACILDDRTATNAEFT